MSTKALLSLEHVGVSVRKGRDLIPLVTDGTFSVGEGEIVCLVGESGSGKSMLARTIMGLTQMNDAMTVSGSIVFDGTELIDLPQPEFRLLRGNEISMIFQEPLISLDPVYTIDSQLREAVARTSGDGPADVHAHMIDLLNGVGIRDGDRVLRSYPFQLSGGMCQRVMIAMGLAGQPRLLIADEPTTALDVTVQKQILDLIDEVRRDRHMSMVMVTHDMGVAARMADRIAVMRAGVIIETGTPDEILGNPKQEYTRALVNAAPSVAIARSAPAAQVHETSAPRDDAVVIDNIVEIDGLTKVYPVRGRGEDFVAVSDVSLTVPRGKTVAIVGESGSGKTTTARMLLKLVEPTSGTIRFDGQDVSALDRRATREFRQRVQPIFQDPYSSLDPTFTIERILSEPLDFYRRGSRTDRKRRVRQLLDDVALPETMLRRRPSELSGGQRQRVAIARALALSPDLVVCDEPVSALDVLVQDQILRLLSELQREYGLSYLFISHDLAVVRSISDEVGVMKDGVLVEAASGEEIFTDPQDPYTKRLLASIPGNELNIAL